MSTRKRGLPFLFSKLIHFKFTCALQRGNSQFAHLRGNYQPRMLDFARDVMQLPCTSSHMDGTIRQGITPPAGLRTHVQAAMTSLAHKKNKPRDPRDSPREHMCSTVRNLHRAFC